MLVVVVVAHASRMYVMCMYAAIIMFSKIFTVPISRFHADTN